MRDIVCGGRFLHMQFSGNSALVKLEKRMLDFKESIKDSDLAGERKCMQIPFRFHCFFHIFWSSRSALDTMHTASKNAG